MVSKQHDRKQLQGHHFCQCCPSRRFYLDPCDSHRNIYTPIARVVKWQTRAFKGRMPKGMRVRVPPRAPFKATPKQPQRQCLSGVAGLASQDGFSKEPHIFLPFFVYSCILRGMTKSADSKKMKFPLKVEISGRVAKIYKLGN